MEIIKIPELASQARREPVRCYFCPIIFGTIAETTEHILRHFAKEFCQKCDQNLIRIGGNLYVLHGTQTCIDKTMKKETLEYDEYERGSPFVCYDSVDLGLKDGAESIETIDFNGEINQLEHIELKQESNLEYDSDGDESFPNFEAEDVSIEERDMKIEIIDTKRASEKNVETFDTVENGANTEKSPKPQQKRNHSSKCGKTDEDKIREANERKVVNIKCTFEGCDEMYSAHGRSAHWKNHNTTIYDCGMCEKTFWRKDNLRIHMLRIHKPSETKQFGCLHEGCPKRFRSTSQRIEHMRVHTGEKPFTCSAEGCDRRFSYRIDLKRHRFRAHGIYTKKFPCHICAEIFPENMLLKKHLIKHENQL